MNQTFKNALKIFSDHNGILRTHQALSLGITPRTLYALYANGLLRQLSRGVFQLADEELLGNPDLVNTSLRIPKAVICLISALYYYGMTTQIPHKVYIALPQPAEKPRLEFPPLDIIWLSEKVYSSGIVEQNLDGFPVKFYSREKTIADCFKFRNKVGNEVALEALKEYIKMPEKNLDQLLEYARIDRVEKLIIPYLEALL
jgi:predicted transcriptional regulator of viral defense system